MRTSKRAGSIVALALTFMASAAAAQATETFTAQVSVTNGTTLGQCNQIVARIGGSGAVNVGGGLAQLAFPADTDAAFFASTQPAPATPYAARAAYTSIDAPLPSNGDNALVLLGLYDFLPAVGASAVWKNHGMIEVALTVDASFSGVYIGYFDAADVPYTWSGTSWHVGLANFTYAFTFTPNTPYEVTLQRSTTGFKVLVYSGTTKITETTEFPLTGPRPAPNGAYFAVGDVLSDLGRGSVILDELQLPGCAVTPDAGVPDAGTPDAGTPDAAAPDASLRDGAAADAPVSDKGQADGGQADGGQADKAVIVPDGHARDAGAKDAWRDGVDPTRDAARRDAPPADNGVSTDAGPVRDGVATLDSKIALGDGSHADLGGDAKRDEKSGCDCATGAAPPSGGTLLFGLLLAIALLRRRRR